MIKASDRTLNWKNRKRKKQKPRRFVCETNNKKFALYLCRFYSEQSYKQQNIRNKRTKTKETIKGSDGITTPETGKDKIRNQGDL
mmetsp:Transcript_43948/g.64566  ORF Transcript_43948/g.64566 Transcript_43948/m.64566 type:complete len:85 (-) Transcript_43948:228-482(-)